MGSICPVPIQQLLIPPKDESKPTCQRCQRANMPCEGYKGYIFVADKSYLPKARPKDKARSSASQPAKPASPGSSSTNSSQVQVRYQTASSNSSLRREPDMSSFRHTISQQYLMEHFLAKIGQDNSSLYNTLSNLSMSTMHSIGALTSAFFGRIHGQIDMRQKAAVHYGQALRYLAKDLSDPKTAWSVSILYSTITLAYYEVGSCFRCSMQRRADLIPEWSMDS